MSSRIPYTAEQPGAQTTSYTAKSITVLEAWKVVGSGCMLVMLQPMQHCPPMRMEFSKALRKLGSVILMTLRPFRPSKALIQELAWPCQQGNSSCMCVQLQQQPSVCHPLPNRAHHAS